MMVLWAEEKSRVRRVEKVRKELGALRERWAEAQVQGEVGVVSPGQEEGWKGLLQMEVLFLPQDFPEKSASLW